MRSGVRAAVVGGAFVLVVGGVGYGAYSMLGGGGGGGDDANSVVGESGTAPAAVPTGPLKATEIRDTAKDFLAAWASGDRAEEAADLTNDAGDALPLITAYHDDAHVTKAVITPGAATGATVPYTVDATVSYGGRTKEWSYRSTLKVVRGETTGKPLVDWQPSVVYPGLTRGTTLVTGTSPTPPVEAVDRNGVVLDAATYPSLGPILDALRERYGAQAGGAPDISLRIEDDASTGDGSDTAAPKTVLTLSEGRVGKVQTTLDAHVQAAAEAAVKRYTNSSVVAVKPSNGDILAVANNRADGFDAALLGTQAPGSTMKLVTSALLMEKGLAAPDQPMPCPETVTYMGRTFHNENDFSLKDGSTMTDAFAQSCNTAFIKLIDDTHDDAGLSEEAEQVFDIGNNDWKIGVVDFDGKVPPETGGEAAAQYIGQGTVQMDVLDMASITATIKSGSFHQPVLVPESFDHRQLATARRPLPASVSQGITEMMRTTARSGTAAQAMAGLGGDKGAKTGSAEVDDQGQTNSWFTAFKDDCVATAVVQAGGSGAGAAGPLVASVLAAD